MSRIQISPEMMPNRNLILRALGEPDQATVLSNDGFALHGPGALPADQSSDR